MVLSLLHRDRLFYMQKFIQDNLMHTAKENQKHK